MEFASAPSTSSFQPQCQSCGSPLSLDQAQIALQDPKKYASIHAQLDKLQAWSLRNESQSDVTSGVSCLWYCIQNTSSVALLQMIPVVFRILQVILKSSQLAMLWWDWINSGAFINTCTESQKFATMLESAAYYIHMCIDLPYECFQFERIWCLPASLRQVCRWALEKTKTVGFGTNSFHAFSKTLHSNQPNCRRVERTKAELKAFINFEQAN